MKINPFKKKTTDTHIQKSDMTNPLTRLFQQNVTVTDVLQDKGLRNKFKSFSKEDKKAVFKEIMGIKNNEDRKKAFQLFIKHSNLFSGFFTSIMKDKDLEIIEFLEIEFPVMSVDDWVSIFKVFPERNKKRKPL